MLMRLDRALSNISLACGAAILASAAGIALAADRIVWPSGLPIYDHIVIVVEENKDIDQILGDRFDTPYIKQLAAEGAVFERMYAEEHYSQGNYFWLFSGSNHNVGFFDRVPSRANHADYPFQASNLASELIRKGLTFKGYAEDLPAIGFEAESSSNLRFADFPSDYSKLPTVAFVIPNLNNDMHNGRLDTSIAIGDAWLKQNLDGYYQWAKTHNSMLIVTFDENDD